MRFLFATVLVLSCDLCWAEDISDGNIKPRLVRDEQVLTAEQAAELANDFEGDLRLRCLTSIDKDVAKELAKFMGKLYLNGLTSIDKHAANELAGFKGHLELGGLTSIDRDVAQALAKAKGDLYLKGLISIDNDVASDLAEYEGALLYLHGRTLIDELGLIYLKSNTNIHLPEKYRNKKK